MQQFSQQIFVFDGLRYEGNGVNWKKMFVKKVEGIYYNLSIDYHYKY